MPALPVISGKLCISVLERLGYEVVRTRGSHVRLARPARPPLTVPLHDELRRGTLRSILRTAEISMEDFVQALGEI